MLDREWLEDEVKVRQAIFDRIEPIYKKDLRLLKQAKRRLALFLGNE